MALSDVTLFRRGGTDAKRVRAGAIRRNTEVSRAGLLTCDLPTADLRDVGLPTELVGYWIEHSHPTAGIWGGEVVISDPTSDGLIRLTCETFHTLTKKRFTTPVKTRRRQRPTSGTAGALFKRAFNDINGRREGPTMLILGEIEESGPMLQADWAADDFYDSIAPKLTDEAGFEWDVSPDRVVRFATRIGRDRTGSVRLSEGVHISSFAGPTKDIALVENVLVGRGQFRARHRGHSRMFNPSVDVLNQASIDRYGVKEGERDFGKVKNMDALKALLDAELVRTAEPPATLRVTLAPTSPDGSPDWLTFGLGDTVRVALDSVALEVNLKIVVMALDCDQGVLELAGDSVAV